MNAETFLKNSCERLKRTRLWKEIDREKEAFLALFILAFFFLNTTFVFAEGKGEERVSQSALSPQAAFEELVEILGKTKVSPPSFNTPRGRITRRILSLPFREDQVYRVLLGYGVTVELELPEEVEDLVPPDENLVSADYRKNKAYLKGIAYAAGESTNVHINTLSGKALHLQIKIVEPEESDHAFKFTLPSKEVFTKSHVAREIKKEKEKLETEIREREDNLEKVTEELSEEKLKAKLLREAKVRERGKLKTKELEIRDLEVSRVSGRVYLKFSLRNRSKHDFPIGEIFLSRGIPDPKAPDKLLGFEPLTIDSPTLESGTVASGEEVKVLLAFEGSLLRQGERVSLKVVEEGSLGRVLEFKEVPLFSR